MTLIEATKKAVTDHICNCDYSVECDSHPVHVNAFAEAIWRAAVFPKAAEAPGGQQGWEGEANLWRERCQRLVDALRTSKHYVADEVCAVIDSFECEAAPAAPSERADPSLEVLWTEFLWQDSQGNKSASKSTEAVAKRFAEFVSSQEGK